MDRRPNMVISGKSREELYSILDPKGADFETLAKRYSINLYNTSRDVNTPEIVELKIEYTDPQKRIGQHHEYSGRETVEKVLQALLTAIDERKNNLDEIPDSIEQDSS